MYRKYHLLTGLTCKLRYVPSVSEITPVKVSHIVFPVYLEIWDFSGYSEKSNTQEAYLPITSISGQNLIVSEIFKPSYALMTPYKSF